jgi:hypothetical protein
MSHYEGHRPCDAPQSRDVLCAGRRDSDLAAWQQAREAERRLVLQIADYAVLTWGWDFFKEGFRWFSRGTHSAESERRALSVFDPWFAFTWVANPNDDDEEIDGDVPEHWPKAPLGLTWLASGTAAASAFDQAFIVTAAASPFSLLLVEAVQSEWFLEVRDLLSGRRFRVVDPEISMHARAEDILLSAVLTLDGVSTFLGPASYTLPSDWRTEALDTRRVYTESTWLSRTEMMSMHWEMFIEYRDACDRGPMHYLDAGGDACEPMVLRWTVSEPLAEVLERLRPLSAGFNDEDAIELEHWPDGAPHVLMTWFEPDAQNDDHRMRAFLHMDEGSLVADVPTVTLANRLIAEVAAHLGRAATLVEKRSATSTRVHARECLLPVAAEWWLSGQNTSEP